MRQNYLLCRRRWCPVRFVRGHVSANLVSKLPFPGRLPSSKNLFSREEKKLRAGKKRRGLAQRDPEIRIGMHKRVACPISFMNSLTNRCRSTPYNVLKNEKEAESRRLYLWRSGAVGDDNRKSIFGFAPIRKQLKSDNVNVLLQQAAFPINNRYACVSYFPTPKNFIKKTADAQCFILCTTF